MFRGSIPWSTRCKRCIRRRPSPSCPAFAFPHGISLWLLLAVETKSWTRQLDRAAQSLFCDKKASVCSIDSYWDSLLMPFSHLLLFLQQINTSLHKKPLEVAVIYGQRVSMHVNVPSKPVPLLVNVLSQWKHIQAESQRKPFPHKQIWWMVHLQEATKKGMHNFPLIYNLCF